MGAGMRFAKALVLAWTRLYTAGLPEELRARRCAEIESDVWEFEHDPNRPRFAAAHLLLRLVSGIWHDLSWRVEQRTPHLAPQRLMLSGTPRHPVIVTSAFTCSLTVHLIVGVAVTWLVAFPFHRRPLIAMHSTQSATAPSPEFSGSETDETDSSVPGGAEANTFLEKLLQNRYALSVNRGELAGAGADVLRLAIERARFVLLGETHGNPETPAFFGAVCNTAGPMGFRTLAVEEGPGTAAHLEAFAKQPGGLAQLRAFEKRSPDTIHLYSRREEFDMLQQCARALGAGFQLWGLIEEGIFRTPPTDPGEGRRRERVMKSVFDANYQKASIAAEPPAKVLLKFGAFHVYRGLNPVGGTGIGNHVAELAAVHGAESLHIRVIPVKGVTGRPGAQYLQPMLDNLLPSEWTMFDLRPLRRSVDYAANPELGTLVFGYDILIMVPEGRPATQIR